MEKEKLRLKAAYLLLGRKKTAFFVSVFPVVIKMFMGAGSVLAALQPDFFISGKHKFALVALLVLAQVGGFILLRCFVLIRYRWFSLCSNSNAEKLSSLIIEFSFLDFLLAVKLWLFSVFRRLKAFIMFLLFPLLCSVGALYYLYSGASTTMLAVVLTGLLLLGFVGLFFFCAAVSCTRAVCGLCCFENKGVYRKLSEKISVLDKNALRYIGFKLRFYPWFSSRKNVANVFFIDTIFKKFEKNNSIVNNL